MRRLPIPTSFFVGPLWRDRSLLWRDRSLPSSAVRTSPEMATIPRRAAPTCSSPTDRRRWEPLADGEGSCRID